jgi:FlaA1/EpsC-like NDP-sugar epimerase
VRLTELPLIIVIGLTLYAAYPPLEGLFWLYGLATCVTAGVAMLAFQVADIYQVQAFRGHAKQYMRLASAWSMVFLLVIGLSFFAKAGQEFSRLWLGTFYFVGLIALLIERKIWFYAVRHWRRHGRLTRRTVIGGGGDADSRVIDQLREQKDCGVDVIGLFDDRTDERGDAESAGERKLGTVEDLVEFGRRTRLDLVIFSLPISAENRILQMLKKLWVLPVDIRLAAHSNKLRLRPRTYSYIGSVPVLDLADRPIADWDVVMKWLFDKIVGGPDAARSRADYAHDRDRDQTREQGPDLLQAEALRLQQRPDRSL